VHFSEMIFERCYSSSEEASLASGQPYCWAVAVVRFSSATKAYLAITFHRADIHSPGQTALRQVSRLAVRRTL
jgi:hypothetical protein